MTFVHQALAWGFLIALAPVLIHLINMMRHQRVKWAAMDFLLQSYRKHRHWVWLKQLLLLLMRMLAIALVVAMLAGWVTRDQWLAIFGQQATHHYVLLDDSYSMSERSSGASAFDRATRTLSRIAAQAKNQDSRQRFTLIRFSRAYGYVGESDESNRLATMADLNAQAIDADFDLLLDEQRNTFEATELTVGPRPALEAVQQLIKLAPEENRVVYLVSDFRSNQWDNPVEIREAFRELERSGATIQLVSCTAAASTPNLAISELKPSDETRAAGVPLFVEVTIKNHGDSPAHNVPLSVRSVFYDPNQQTSGSLVDLPGAANELPNVLIDEIPAGGTVVRRAQVYFPAAGQHIVQATLPDDAVAADNRRWCVIDFPEGENVLIVNGNPTQQNAYFMASVFQPGSRAATGIRPDVKNAAFLRDSSPETLEAYSAVYLLDVERLDDRAVENIENYVSQGGGLGLFVGENVNVGFYNRRLHQEGQGLLPLPLGLGDLLPPELSENRPDVEVSDHPVFRIFAGERNPLIRMVSVERYLRPAAGWSPPPDSTVQVVAQLRNRYPLAVEQQYGEGRVIIFLTTLAPQWNNWGHDPSFVVVLLQLQSHLASAGRATPERLVAAPIELQLDAERYRKDIRFIIPGLGPDERVEIQRTAQPPEEDSPILIAWLGRELASGYRSGETDRSGIYEAWPPTVEGRLDVRRYAVNVDPVEGDLTITAPQLLLNKLDPVKVEFRRSDELEYALNEQAGFNRSLLLMGLLVCLLLGEQVLAYFASYHPPRGGAR